MSDQNEWELLVALELDAMAAENAAMTALLDLHEQGLRDNGHWGPDSADYGELIQTVRARKAFPASTWWRE